MTLEIPPAEYNNFARSIKFTLPHEVKDMKTGSYTNIPGDLGGETKWGISKKAHPNVDIKNLTLEGAMEIYYNEYWKTTVAPALEYPFCTVVFDTAVLCGTGRANAWAKKSGGSAREYLNLRKDFHTNRVRERPDQSKFLSGWINRVLDLAKLVDLPQ